MFTCNITGNKFDLEEEEKTRDGGLKFGYNSRFRAICYLLSKMLFRKIYILEQMEENKEIKGIGMSDSDWANICSKKFNYTNTFYHTEPRLDITNNYHVQQYNDLDFIISSDVFEHIDPFPGIQHAFNNMYKMLKDGGFIIFSVPYSYKQHIEHFPSLYNYTIIKENDEYIIKNKTIDGKEETFTDLVFHGGPGNILEMRVFSCESIQQYLKNAGFKNIIFHSPNEDMHKYGIFWENICSLIITATK